MGGSRKMVEFFYDIVSPYSWLAFEVLCRYRNVWNIDLKFKPAYLGGVMHGSGNQPPGIVPNKFLYMTKDLERVSGYFGVPLYPPSNVFEVMFEKGTLNTMRFVTAVTEKEKDGDVLVERVSRELWKRIWSTDQDVTQPASLIEAGLKAGLSANELEEILTLSKSQPIKDKLKSVTQEALDYQCFGFPSTVCHVNGKAELFFGSDRFELMAHCIGEKWVGPHPDKPTSKM
ncbi:glutathione S-transferase kappa 1 [Carassius auratus]|uniref:Glutathione S-transferase kappa n=1 Tax=Carassius auratus TaxID=7957 RepID=A0A6P6R1S3_CARAU|nr:glutathione S-transferase kappa 1-like [Carassius auratus]